MEKISKDILNWKICDIFELSLKDVFALAHTCKTLYENTRPYLDNIRAMFEKWTPRRCLLELKRATNISDTQKRKIRMHYIKHVQLEFHSPFANLCIENNVDKMIEYITSYQGNVENLHETLCVFAYCVLYGSWDCYDVLNSMFPVLLDRLMTKKRIQPIRKETTLKSKEDLSLYIEQCYKRGLHKLPCFPHIVLVKCFEVDDYDRIHQLKYSITPEFVSFFIYCDDERFLCDFPKRRLEYDGKDVIKLFGNKHLQKKIKSFIV